MKKLLSVIAVFALLLMVLGAGCMCPYGPGSGPRHSNDPGLFGPNPSDPPPPPPR